MAHLAPEHSRAARGWLGWSQTELASRARVSLSTVRDFETGRRTPIANNLEAIKRAIEQSGVELVSDGLGRPAGILVRATARD
jgi:ribosome-binding protein aMBF1 (putative translation factor)